MLVIVVTMLMIIVVAAAVLVYAAYPARGVEPTRGRWFVRSVSWIAARYDDLSRLVAQLIARIQSQRREASHRRSG